MPPKIRDLENKLAKAGFKKRTGKGSHRKWVHKSGVKIIISGKAGDDAKKYQEREVEQKIDQVKSR